jgi:hypothetical protein
VASYNRLLKRCLAFCCSCSKSAAKSPALVAVFVGPLKIAKLALSKRMHPLFRLFYQVEIRHHQNPSSKIPDQLTTATSANTTRLWQLRGLLRRNCWIADNIPVGRHAVFDGGRRECALFWDAKGRERSNRAEPQNVE